MSEKWPKRISLKRLNIKKYEILEALLAVFAYDGYNIKLGYNEETDELELVVPKEDVKRLRKELMPFLKGGKV